MKSLLLPEQVRRVLMLILWQTLIIVFRHYALFSLQMWWKLLSHAPLCRGARLYIRLQGWRTQAHRAEQSGCYCSETAQNIICLWRGNSAPDSLDAQWLLKAHFEFLTLWYSLCVIILCRLLCFLRLVQINLAIKHLRNKASERNGLIERCWKRNAFCVSIRKQPNLQSNVII